MAELTYEKAMEKLEKIVETLGKGNTDLDESLRLFEEGTSLATFCNKALDNAEQKITMLDQNKGDAVDE